MNKIEPNFERQEDCCQNCKILQKQIYYKQQEFLHLKDGHRRLQQVLAEKGAELSHAIRRAEINEREMRKIKLRLHESKTKESKYIGSFILPSPWLAPSLYHTSPPPPTDEG